MSYGNENGNGFWFDDGGFIRELRFDGAVYDPCAGHLPNLI